MKTLRKALPRGQRQHPQAARVFSTNFLPQMLEYDKKTFVAYDDYIALEKKYIKLFKRYQRKRLEFGLGPVKPFPRELYDKINELVGDVEVGDISFRLEHGNE